MYNSRVGRTYTMPQALKATGGDATIINKLAAEFTDRSKKDIQAWRQALEAADDAKNPRWSLLQDLYEYLRPDGHLGSQMDIRRGLTEATRYYIRDSKTGKEDPEKTKLIETEWMLNLLGDLTDRVFFGYTAIQITDPANGMYDLLPRRNFVPQKNMLLFETNGDKGVIVTDPAFQKTIVVVKNQYKFGILNDVVPDLIWKKNARQAWAEFSEKFGIPLVTATTLTRDKKELDRIETMLRALGKAAQAVFPQGTTIDVKDSATKGDPYNVFLKQMEYNDSQISKRLLGGTMVSDNGSSRSQAEVHQNTMNYIIAELDRKKTEFAINGQVLPILRLFGFPFSETDEFVFDRSEDLSLGEHWEIISKMIEQGYEIPEEWLSSTFNVPITGRKAPAPVTEPKEEKPVKAKARAKGFFA